MIALLRPLLLGVAMLFASHALATANPMPNQYALVFFFSSDCSYCHQFAPTMQQFQQQTQLPLYEFSFDGKPIPGYHTPIPVTPDIARVFFTDTKNAITPATFLINVNSGKYVHLSRGNVSYQDLMRSYQRVRADNATMESLQ